MKYEIGDRIMVMYSLGPAPAVVLEVHEYESHPHGHGLRVMFPEEGSTRWIWSRDTMSELEWQLLQAVKRV